MSPKFRWYDLTASPASAIWILRVYGRMNIVIACPRARHVAIHPDTVHNLKFSLIPFPKRKFLSIYPVSTEGILINSIQRTNMFFQTLYCYFSGWSNYQETLNDRNAS
jgi:hypothetical protein